MTLPSLERYSRTTTCPNASSFSRFLSDDRLVGLTPSAAWIDALNGYARGVEVLVQRRSMSIVECGLAIAD